MMAGRTIEVVIKGKNETDAAFEGVQANLGELEKGVEKTAMAMDYALGQIAGDALAKMSDALGAFASDAIAASQTYAQEVEDMARQTGASVEESSRMIQIADDMRISTGELSNALKIYAQRVGEAGGATAITVDQLANLSDQYLALQPGVERTNFLIDTFGRGGMAMAKMMDLGGEAIRNMGQGVSESLILTQDAINANEKYRLTIDGLNDAWQGFQMKIGEALTKNESLTKLIDGIAKALDGLALAFAKAPEWVQTGIVAFVLLAAALGKLAPILVSAKVLLGGAGIAGTLATIGATIKGVVLGALGALGGAIGAITAPVWLLIAAIGVLIGTIITLGPSARDTFMMIAEIIAASLYRAGYELQKFWERIKAWATGLYNAVKVWFKSVGQNIVNGIWEGIQGAWESLKTNVETLLNDLLAWVQGAIEAQSPSRVYAREVGAPMAQGIGVGFEAAMAEQARPIMGRALQPAAALGSSRNFTSVGTIQIVNPLTEGERAWVSRNASRVSEATLSRALKGVR